MIICFYNLSFKGYKDNVLYTNNMETEKAKSYYEKHLEYMRNYNKNHRDITNERAKKYYQKLKEDPDKYKLYLEKRRNKYKIKRVKQEQEEEEREPKPEIISAEIIEDDA